VPVVGAVVVAALPKGTGRASLPKLVALGFSLVTLVVVAIIAVTFDTGGPRYQFTEDHEWIRAFGAHYAVGVDGIGLTLVLMTAILSPVVILASWHDGDGGRWRSNAFFAWMLVLEGLSICVFSAIDVFLFYVIFEATLIPIYFLIGGFGGPRRSAAAVKFLIYNLFGGLLMLAAVVGLYVVSARTASGPTYLLTDLSKVHIDRDLARWMFVGFFAAFAIKAPMVPVHTWLPDAAEEGSAGTSVMLVSVLDKIGTFGMIRFCLELFPEASRWATPVVLVLAVVSVLWGALAAIG
jgi:NADH-quinone oxidoreductase subunit M